MKLSTLKWLAASALSTSKPVSQLNERQDTVSAPDIILVGPTSSYNVFRAPSGKFTLPPGPQTLIVSEATIRLDVAFPSSTMTTTWLNSAFFISTDGPVIDYTLENHFTFGSLYVMGDPSLLVTATATIATTESVLTSTTCASSICSPTLTAIEYTCGVSNGATLPVTTVMQTFSCTTGQVCEGVPVKTTLSCNCGGPICNTVLPFIPIPPVVIPIGAPIPPAVPEPPEVPEGIPEVTITEDAPVSEKPTSTSDENSDEPTSTSSESTSSDTSTTSSSTSSSSSSSSTSTSSNSSAPACPLGGFTIASDFDSTLSAWVAQFPFTLPATFSSNSTTIVSTSSSSTSVVSSSSTSTSMPTPTPTPRPTPAPSQTPTSGPTSTSFSCYAACLSSSASASSAFEASLSASMAAGHSSFTQSLSGALASQSASIASAQEAQSAISRCQHYTLGYPWNPPNVPATLATYHGNGNNGRWMCVIDPTQIDTAQYWNDTWAYQPFDIDKGWDREHPTDTLVDTFCNYLVNERVNVTPLGDVQGVCQAYDLGQCLNPTRSGQCTFWEHPWTTLDTWGPVMVSISYDNTCPMGQGSKPMDFGAAGADNCKKSLNTIVDKCSFPKNMQKQWAEYDPTVGGTFWLDCMIYTIIGIKQADKPRVIWQH